jgi:N-dimethylarginine dimethylaminohydrolase
MFPSPATISYPSFLISPPFGLSADEPNNVFMQDIPPEKRKINKSKALRQFLDLYNFLSSISLVYLLPTTPGLQDQIYVSNLFICLPHLKDHPVIISNFKSPPRKEETPIGIDFFKLMNIGPITVSPKYFEGQADLKFLRDNIYFCAHGVRTSHNVHRWFEEVFQMKVIPLQVTDSLYHLDCSIFPLTREKVVVYTKAFTPKEIKSIEQVAEIIPLEDESVKDAGFTNIVRCRRILISKSSLNVLKITDEDYDKERKRVEFITKLAANNAFEPVFFNMSEFNKSGAAVSCQVAHLNYSDYMPGRSEDS